MGVDDSSQRQLGDECLKSPQSRRLTGSGIQDNGNIGVHCGPVPPKPSQDRNREQGFRVMAVDGCGWLPASACLEKICADSSDPGQLQLEGEAHDSTAPLRFRAPTNTPSFSLCRKSPRNWMTQQKKREKRQRDRWPAGGVAIVGSATWVAQTVDIITWMHNMARSPTWRCPDVALVRSVLPGLASAVTPRKERSRLDLLRPESKGWNRRPNGQGRCGGGKKKSRENRERELRRRRQPGSVEQSGNWA